ncbi:MAG: KamA family radical SAM protein [Spirochaeta sp.]|nr:KamA family radical SAM protein [Spirochaeta sp.]
MDQECNKETKERISSIKQLPPDFTLSEEESSFLLNPPQRALPFRVTPYYLSLCSRSDPGDPLRRQCIPTISESRFKEYELEDPLGDKKYLASTRLVHRYRDRALLLATDQCAMYCRHCFRRSSAGKGHISNLELSLAVAYCKEHNEIKEIILSGGDPLTLADDRLTDIIRRFRTMREGIVIRIHSRIPVVLPQRITSGLVSSLANFLPLWLVTQFNHPRELTPDSCEALRRLAASGITLLNQTVLLKGINDNFETLEQLCRSLVRLGVKPYYLFQGDLARGTYHFRTSILEGLKLYRKLTDLSGLLRPIYAVDLPGGGGKVVLDSGSVEGCHNGWLILKSREGKIYRYPIEESQ